MQGKLAGIKGGSPPGTKDPLGGTPFLFSHPVDALASSKIDMFYGGGHFAAVGGEEDTDVGFREK